MSHKVSAIVPCMNVERTLDQALASLEAQTWPNIEIIVLNDGSTDGTLAVMEAHAARDPRIRLIDKRNEGYGATCNRGLDAATGDYIAILEPDDWVEPRFFEDALAYADTFAQEPDIVKTPYWRIFEEEGGASLKTICPYKGRVHPRHQPFAIAEAPELLLHHPSIWSALYRKAWLDEKGIRFEEIPGAGWADNPFLVETLCQTARIVYLDRPYYCYRDDTPEETVAYVRKHLDIPLARWNDMMDVLDRLHIQDESVQRALAVRGINYGLITIEAGGLADPQTKDLIVRSWKRMDPELVLGTRTIRPAAKRRWCELVGLPEPDISDASYYPVLAEEALRRLVACGPRYTFRAAADFLRRRGAQNGA